MTNRGRAADRGRGRASVSAGAGPGGRRSEPPNTNREHGGTHPSFRGGASDRGSGRGSIIHGGTRGGRGQAKYVFQYSPPT